MNKEEGKKGFRIEDLFQKKNALFMVGIAGILLIGLSDFLFKPKQETQTTTAQQTSYDTQPYLQETEQRLVTILESVEGAGKVQVMLTLESAGETVFAVDEQTDTSTQEQEGEQVQRRATYQNEHILYDSGEGKTPLIETQTQPEVRGVAIVCEGGDDITVVQRITELVSVVLGLSTNRICVTKMI